MQAGRRIGSGLLLVAAWLALVLPAQAGTWLVPAPDGGAGIKEALPGGPFTYAVNDRERSGFDVTVRIDGFELTPVKTPAGEFVELRLPGEGLAGTVGQPGLPVLRWFFIAPDGAGVSATVQAGEPVSVDGKTLGMTLRPKPIQPPIEKVPGARERTPFAFEAAAYRGLVDYAPERVTVTELGLVRGQRLFLLEVAPLVYDADADRVFFWTDLSVSVQFTGGSRAPAVLTPMPGLRRIVLNPSLVSTVQRRGSGNYLIVVSDVFASQIASFAAAKQAQGYTVTTHTVPAGTSATTIKSYIQGLWGGPDSPDYLLLVGDTDTIPAWVGSGTGSPDTDLPYACMDGGDDWYPDIAIGRFSARNADDMQTLIDKTLYYENGPLADPNYVKRAAFMASVDNYQISEGTHNYVIDTWLEPNDFLCDRLYQVTYGATTQDVRDAFNDGRFYGIYSGHGSSTSWADGPPFSQSDVENLTNANMYAFICSFACDTGDFDALDECFMETWVRAPNKAAVAAWGSSVSSYWDEDDILERVLFDAIFDENLDLPKDAGWMYNEAKMRLLEHYGPTGTIRRYFEMYNLLGDPSLPHPGACSDAGTIQLDSTKYACEDTVGIQVADCGLNLDPNLAETVDITIVSDSEPAGETVTLTETGPNSATFQGTIPVSGTDAAGVLLVAAGDTLTATYIDEDDGQGGTFVEVTATATVDCTPPVIANVQVTDIEPRSAVVTFDTDEPARGIVHYGLSCDSLTETAYGGGYSTTPSVTISGLQDNTTYYFMVEAEDEAGNVGADPGCYDFTTPEIPDFFTELFSSGNDLDNLSLLFVPNGSADFYFGCVTPITELPTDPAGGTTLPLSDDDSEVVNLGGGNAVYLYGTAYSSFYVGSNGYLTFGGSDTDYTESLEDHFDMPRISALFDDLNPSSGGTVSYKVLSDRVAVTWQDVPEYGSSNANTFQVELFFDGSIAINYLAIAADDGLAGLSEGAGLSPDYYPSDLSAMGSCGPRPPSASSQAIQTPIGTPVTIELLASDDGLPDPPGALSYILLTLPEHGTLTDPGAGAITAVPYTLVGGGNQVVYDPQGLYSGPDAFDWKANDGGTPPEGGDSNVATVSITVGGPQLVYAFYLDEDPGWSTEGQWAYGVPTGGGGSSGNPDPTSGHTGTHVYGYNLNGDYTNNMPRYYLTTNALDCTGLTDVELRYYRWLGVESATFDHAGVEVSNDGVNWVSVWEHMGYSVSDSQWTQYTHDISDVADGQPTVYIRWAMGTTDGSVTYCGWNLDDIEIWAVVPYTPALGDLNCDGVVNAFDIDPFILALTDPAAYQAAYPDCDLNHADLNGDGQVNAFDIDPFIDLLTGK